MKAILFDMDGVLMDSEPVITASAIAALKEYGVNALDEDFKPFTGTGEDRFIGGVSEKYGVPFRPEMKARTYSIYLTLVDRELLVYRETLATLERLGAMGYPMALASSADRVKVDANLRVANIAPSTFGVILSGDDVARKKPFPDIYLEAARRLGAQIGDCVVIEDAVSGILAGKAAGARCVGITTSFDRNALEKAGADAVVGSIGEIIGIIDGWSGEKA